MCHAMGGVFCRCSAVILASEVSTYVVLLSLRVAPTAKSLAYFKQKKVESKQYRPPQPFYHKKIRGGSCMYACMYVPVTYKPLTWLSKISSPSLSICLPQVRSSESAYQSSLHVFMENALSVGPALADYSTHNNG